MEKNRIFCRILAVLLSATVTAGSYVGTSVSVVAAETSALVDSEYEVNDNGNTEITKDTDSSSDVSVVTDSAEEEEITQKNVTAYLYGMDNSEILQCLFKSTMPDMPYISTTDFCSNVFKGTFTEEKNSDGTYTVSAPKGTMVINTDDDTLYFESFESFAGSEPDADGSALDAPYCQPSDVIAIGETNSLTLDLGEYHIDLIESDGKTYMPVSFISILFSITYNAAAYANGNVYFVHCSDILSDQDFYFDRTEMFKNDSRSQEIIDLTYNELCFAIDKIYGRPSKSEIASYIAENGLDKTLDEYSDETRRAKELMLSDSKADFVIGICCLSSVFFDGGHTILAYPMVNVLNFYPESAVGTILSQRLNDMNDQDAMSAINQFMKLIYSQADYSTLVLQKMAAYENYETIRIWDDASASQLVCSGDTAIFAFDSFVNEAVYHFKWSLDYAKESGMKRFVIDISSNVGGSSAVAYYMMAMMTNKNKDNNTSCIRTIETITRNIFESYGAVDLNLDGMIDESDKEVYYDFEFAIQTSRYSHSCSNLLSSLAKDNGIVVIGETSGGGSCALDIIITPELMPYTISMYNKFINKNNEDVDSGVIPDYNLTSMTKDEYGNEVVDYSEMYNAAKYSSMIDEFYGVAREPSKPFEQPSEEPSQEPSDEPSEKLSETSQELSNKPSEKLSEPSQESTQKPADTTVNKPADKDTDNKVSEPNNNSFATGDNSDVQYVILVMLMASVTIIAFASKKKKAIQ